MTPEETQEEIRKSLERIGLKTIERDRLRKFFLRTTNKYKRRIYFKRLINCG